MSKQDKENLKTSLLIVSILGMVFSIPYLIDTLEELPTVILMSIALMIIMSMGD